MSRGIQVERSANQNRLRNLSRKFSKKTRRRTCRSADARVTALATPSLCLRGNGAGRVRNYNEFFVSVDDGQYVVTDRPAALSRNIDGRVKPGITVEHVPNPKQPYMRRELNSDEVIELAERMSHELEQAIQDDPDIAKEWADIKPLRVQSFIRSPSRDTE